MPDAHNHRRDRQLLARLVSGDAQALADLYDGHAPALLRHALALVRGRGDAEDLVQAVFVKLASSGSELLGVRVPAAYLHRMLHTAWIDQERRRLRGARAVDRADASRESVSDSVESTLDVSRALGGLPAVQREAIVLHLVEGFSFREIGRQTGVSLFTAAGRYRLGLRRLRATLQMPGGVIDEGR